VDGKRGQTQRCKTPSPTLCVFVTCIRSRSGRSSIAPFPMQNIVAKTTQQRTIARDDVSLKMTLMAVSCSFFFVSCFLGGKSVRELVSTGVGKDTVGDAVVKLVGTCTPNDISFMLTLTTVSCSFFIVS
jgi:hypothetical protein